MAEIDKVMVADVSPNTGAVMMVITAVPTHASTNTVVVPSGRMAAIKAAMLINNVDGGVPKACTWDALTVTLTGVGAGGTGDEHTLIVWGV